MQGGKQLVMSTAPRRTIRTSKVERLRMERTLSGSRYESWGSVGRRKAVARQLRCTLGILGYSVELAQAEDDTQENSYAVPCPRSNRVRSAG